MIPIHPLFFAVYPPLQVFSVNIWQASFPDLIRSSVGLILIAVSFWAVAAILLRSREGGALVVSISWLAFFLYKPFLRTLTKSGFLPQYFRQPLWPFGLFILLLLVISYILTRRPRILRAATIFLNVASASIVLLSAGESIYRRSSDFESAHVASDKPSGTTNGKALHETKAITADRTRGAKPDIFYIILDRFGRSDLLRQIYGLDNSSITEALQKRGFRVLSESTSNYTQTILSLSSTLNMAYLDSISDMKAHGGMKNRPALEELRNNRAMKLLKSLGYHSIYYSSGYSGTDVLPFDKRRKDPLSLTEFEHAVLKKFPLPLLLKKLPFSWAREFEENSHRRGVLYAFDHISDTQETSRPNFIFAHIMCPHPPFVFDRNGPVESSGRSFSFNDGNHLTKTLGRGKYISGYSGQASFIGERIIALVDRIRLKFPGAIIILQGDHGPGSGLHWQSVKKTDLRERFGILNAIHAPSDLQMRFNDSTTPVNTFRNILSYYFGADLPPLPDRNYFSTWTAPNVFIDVTSEVQKP